MCGILAAAAQVDLWLALGSLEHRGPDAQAWQEHAGVSLGQTRLAIQDLAPAGGGLFTAGPVVCAYNGELFNGPEVRSLVEAARPGYVWHTHGDTETVTAALGVLHPQDALAAFDGMFAVAWADTRHPGVLFCARDRFGEIPLHIHRHIPALVASEIKAFAALGRRCGDAVMEIPPASVCSIRHAGAQVTVSRYLPALPPVPAPPTDPPAELRRRIRAGVTARLISDAPICTLLSGGLDSAVIAYELGLLVPGLVAYTAVMDKHSPDLRAARVCAEHLGVELREVTIDPPSADDLANVVRQIEQPHKAQVEIGWPCLALARQIREDGFKVTYSGEGADELWASYGFAYHGVKQHGWFGYRLRLITEQHRKNFPRVNKAFMAHAVEARLPWLDPGVVGVALALPVGLVRTRGRLKGIVEDAYHDVLPGKILARSKLAFQDGLGMKEAAASVAVKPREFYGVEYRRAYS